MNKYQQDYQYDASYGKKRNLQGNKNFQEQQWKAQNVIKSHKKHFEVTKGEIEQYGMLNIGKSYAPVVSDLILDISDIPGTQTDSLKSDGVKNRLIAKNLRESRQQKNRVKQQHTEPVDKLTEISARQILKRNFNQSSLHTVGSVEYEPYKLEFIQKPSIQLHDKNYSSVKVIIPQMDTNPQKAHSNNKFEPQKRSNSMRLGRQLSIIEPSFSQQINQLEQRILDYKRDRDKTTQKKRSTKIDHFLEESLQNSQQNAQKPSRINPTFLSYGSQFLSKNSNYLASFGKSLLS